ncbi:unnamed protein product [Brachionus calyciflorus]|uniref:G-protein coupled receptors family 1 profile domain-containing protein n=1 Tax=Brachionus calyciflorus TaxID=104777 RepID=A0A813MCU2_9BILA|nr:unnamed protein product [Brachionus calyciflorus]
MIEDYLNNMTTVDALNVTNYDIFLKYFNLINVSSVNQKMLLGLIITIISFTAIFGNTLVIVAFIFNKSLRTVSNFFILSLSISDLMIGLFVMPLSGTIIIFDKWIWGASICRSWLTIDYIASTASIFNLFTLSLERYLSIAYPLKFMTIQSKSKAKIAVLVVWLISSLWLIPINVWSLIFNDKYNLSKNTSEKCSTNFETDKIFKIVTTIFNFYIPCIGMIIIYSKIFRTIIKRSKSEIGIFCYTSHAKPNESAIKKNNSKSSMGSNLYDSISNNDINQNFESTSDYQSRPKTVTFKKVTSNLSSSTLSSCNKAKKDYYIETNSKIFNLKRINTNGNRPQRNKKNFALFSFVNCRGQCKSSIKENDIKFTTRRNALVDKCPPTARFDSTNSIDIDKIKTNGIFGIVDRFIPKKKSKKDIYSVRLKQQIKAAKQLGILILAFLITWMPYFITFIVVAFCSDCVSDNLSSLTLWLGYLNSAINPLLYPQCNSSFKHAFRRMLRISPKRKKNQNDIIKLMHNTYK